MKKVIFAFVLLAPFSVLTFINLPLSATGPQLPPSITLEVGTPAVSLYFYFDTAIDTTWVHSKQCSTCAKLSTYSCLGSTTCDSTTTTPLQISYYGATLKGQTFVEFINFNVFKLHLLLLGITQEEGVNSAPIDGVIGIGLKNFASESHIISKLMNSGLIDKAVVGIHLSKTGSSLMFGGYDATLVKDPQKIIWFTVKDHWEIPVEDIKIHKIYSGMVKLEIRSGLGPIMVPKNMYEAIVIEITKDSSCQGNACRLKEFDYMSLPSFELKINAKTTWKIDYRYYSKQIKKYQVSHCDHHGSCHYITYVIYELTLLKGDGWALGTDGLQHFYTILDYSSSKIGLLYLGMPKNISKLVKIIVYSLLGASLVIGIVLAVACQFRRRRRYY